MNLLIIGSGGREHALAWKLSNSSIESRIFVAPGNGGTLEVAENVSLDTSNFNEILAFCKEKEITLVVVGPEQPLADGIVDFLENNGVFAIGPCQDAARLESSKDYAKSFMKENGIPTASYRSFSLKNLEEFKSYISSHSLPIVLKASGLAAGKGVIICTNKKEALEKGESMLNGTALGGAGETVVVEQFLDGIEMSVFVLTDGENYVCLPEAKDYKRIGEGDTGPNTGGMGAVSPVPFFDSELEGKVISKIINPSIEGVKEKKWRYNGFLFIGLMIVNSEPYVIEYNVRLGDPETEVILPRLNSDLLELFIAVKEGKLKEADVRVSENWCTTVILVSGGYPGSYQKGEKITGLENNPNKLIFQAGTKIVDGETRSSGGRVIACSSMGKTLEESLKESYNIVESLSFKNMKYRSDIGKDLLKIIS